MINKSNKPLRIETPISSVLLRASVSLWFNIRHCSLSNSYNIILREPSSPSRLSASPAEALAKEGFKTEPLAALGLMRRGSISGTFSCSVVLVLFLTLFALEEFSGGIKVFIIRQAGAITG